MRVPDFDGMAWDGTPPTIDPSFVPIIRPKPRETYHLLVLGDRIEGLWLHWMDCRSVPCFRLASHCPGCLAKARRFWCGFISVWQIPVQKHAVAQIPPVALQRAPDLMKFNGELRGGQLTILRKGDSKRGALTLTYTASGRNLKLPPALDLRRVLGKILIGGSVEDNNLQDFDEDGRGEK